MPKDNQYGAPFVASPKSVNLPTVQGPSPGDPLVTGKYSGPETMAQRFARLQGTSTADKSIKPSNRYGSELAGDLTGRYDEIIPGADNEDLYGQNQSFGAKVVSGVGKGLLLTGTTFLQSTVGLLNGAVNSIKDGRLASFYDNDFNRALDELNKKAEDLLPNYYTAKEKNANWYSSDKLLTGNFIFDGIVKNLGFAAGAALSGGVFAGGLKALPLTARLFSVGKGAEAAIAVEEGLLAANKIASVNGKMLDLSTKFLNNYQNLTTGGRAVVAGLATTGEAGFEAYQNLNTFRDQKIQEFRDANDGMMPQGKDLEKINRLSDSVGKSSFAHNFALLSVTNYIQFPKILGSSFKNESSLMEGMMRNTGDVIKDATGKYGSVAAARTMSQRVLRGIAKVPTSVFSLSEGFEEGAQFAIQMGTKDYYDKMYSLDKANILESVGIGIEKTLTTDEGIENILIGGLSGAIMMARGNIKQSIEKDKNTTTLVKELNDNPISNFTTTLARGVIRGVTLQEEREAQLLAGDKFGSKNTEADSIINYLMPRIKFGRMDLVNADINDYITLASTEKGFNDLIEEGKVLPNENRLAFLNRIEGLKSTAKTMESLYQSLNIRYGNKLNEDGTPLYSESVLEKMMYAGSKIDDFTKRILTTSANTYGANIDDIISGVIVGNDDAYDEALKIIEENTTLAPEQKTDAQEAITDIAKMAIHRDVYTKEYQEFRNNPQNHQEEKTTQDILDAAQAKAGVQIDKDGNPVPKNTILVKTRKGEKALVIGEEYYLGRTAHLSEKGHEMYFFPRLTIIGKNEDGTIRIKDRNGERDITPEVLESYNLGLVSDTDKNKKAKYYMDNINTPYFFNFGKTAGGKMPGRLEYNPADGVLDFVFLDTRLKTPAVKRIEVTREQFKAQGKFKEAMIVRGTPMNLAEAKTEKEFIEDTTEDPRISEKNEKRLAILLDLYEGIVARRDKFAAQIETKKGMIQGIRESLKVLEETIANTPVDKRSMTAVKFKKATRIAMETAIKLNNTQRQLEQEIELLETQQQEMEIAQVQVENLFETVDQLPTNTKEFLAELKEEIVTLEDLHKSNGAVIKELNKLVAITQRAIDSAIDFLGSMITSFEKKYPNVPRVMGQAWVEFLTVNPNFLKLKPTYREELSQIDESIANIEDETIVPNQNRLENLKEHLDLINAELIEIEKLIKAKGIIVYRFEKIINQYKEAQAEKEVVKNRGENIDDMSNSLDNSIQTTEAFEDAEDFEEASKKSDYDVTNSTIASTAAITEGNESAKRSQRFGNRFPKFPASKIFKGRLVTLATEALILPGILEKLFPGSAIDEKQQMIAMVITDESGNLVDEFGEVIPEDSPNKADLAIYQVFPSSELKQLYSKDGNQVYETMFRASTPKEEQDRLKESYTQWRNTLLQTEEIAPLRDIAASFGHAETVESPEERTDIQSAGLIKTSTLLSNNVLTIATQADSADTNRATLTKGSFSLKTQVGMVFLSLPNILVKLYNRKFNIKEASVIYDAIEQLSVLAQKEKGLKTVEATDLFNFLKSTIYWGIARNTQTKVRKDKPGKNNVWFETPTDGEPTLFVGEDAFSFTFENLKLNKQIILSKLLEMYGNTHATYTRKSITDSYSEVTGFDLITHKPITRLWPNYQSYLLSDKYPDEYGTTLTGGNRPTEEIPLKTNIRPLNSSKQEEDFNRSRIYFTILDNVDQYKKPEPEVKAEEIVKTTPEGKKTASNGFTLDGVTTNTIPVGAFGTIDFKLNSKEALVILAKYGADILADAKLTELMAFISELVKADILIYDPVDSKTIEAMLASKVGEDAEEAELLAQGHAAKQITKALVPLLVQEEIKSDPTMTTPVVEPVVAPIPVPVPVVKTVVTPEYKTDGVGVNTLVYNKEENIAFTINEKEIIEDLTNDPTSYDSPDKLLDKAIDLLKSGTIKIDFSEENKTYLEKQTEVEPKDIPQVLGYLILRRVFPQIETSFKKANEPIVEVTPVVETPEVIAEVAPEIVPESGVKIITGNGAPRRRRSANRVKMLDQIEQFDEEVWETLAPELEAMLPQIPVFRVKNIIQTTNGREAWGLFRDGAIYIYKNAEAGTGYHEVFEAVWAMFTDINERKALIAEFNTRSGSFKENGTMRTIEYKDATAAEAKEEMAEEFRRHLLDKKAVKEKSLLRRLFDNMVDFFEAFFFGPKSISNTEALFEKIGNGYYAKYNQYENSLGIAKQGVMDVDNIDAQEDDQYRIKALSAKVEHEVFQHMTFTAINSLIAEGKSFFTVTKKLSSRNLYDLIYKEILGDAENNVPGILDDMYLDLIDNLEAGADPVFTNKRAQDVLVLKQTIHSVWPEVVKQHKKYLMAYNITFDEYDEAVLVDEESKKQDYSESNKVDSFKKAGAAVKLLFATVPDSEEFEGEIYIKPSSINGATFVGTGKVFINLKNVLHDSRDITEMLNRLEALAAKDINYNAVYKRLMKRSAYSNEERKPLTQDDLRLITAFWQVMNSNNPDVLTVFSRPEGETSVGNTSLTNASRQNRQLFTNAIVSSIRQESSKYFSYDEKKKVFNPTDKLLNLVLDTSTAESSAIFLKSLGIDIDGKIIESWKRTNKDAERTKFIKATKGLISDLQKMKDIKYLNSATLDSAGNLLELGTISAIIKNPIFESTYYNLEGEKVQSFIGSNFPSIFYDYFSKAKNLDELDTTPFYYLLKDKFAQHSVIFNKVFNPMDKTRRENTDNIMKVVYVNGTIEDATNDRIPNTQLTYSQRVAQEINLNLDGVYLNLVPGDAELEWGLRMHEKDSAFVKSNDIQAESYQNIFKGYFIDEVNLAREERIVAPGRDTKDLRFFKEILGPELHKKIRNYKGKETAEGIYIANEKEIRAAINAYINEATLETKELLLSYNLITKTEEGYTTSLGFANKEMDNTVMDLELKKLTINYIIANTEMHKLLYSDPFQYEDELKRIKNYNSPRQMLADSQEINNDIHNVYNQGYEKGDLGYDDMVKDHLRTIVFEEINAIQDLDGLPNYIEAQNSWKEGDGGGLMTMKANRLLSIKASNWSENDEKQYRHDVIYEEIVDAMNAATSRIEKERLIEELAEHEKTNPGVHSTYTPRKFIVAGSKSNGRDYNDQILDKYALFTMSFRLLHKLNPNSDAIKLYKKMSTPNSRGETIDYGVFPSARKVGREIIHPLYDDNGNFDETPFETEEQRVATDPKEKRAVTNIPFKIIGVQTDVPSKDKFEGTQGSQVTKLVTMDFRQGGVPIDYTPKGVSNPDSFDEAFVSWMKLSDTEKQEQSPLYKEITRNKNILEARVEKGYYEVLNLLGIKEIDGGYEIADREKLVSTLESEMLKREVNNNILDAFESFRKEGAAVILEATPLYQQIRYILYALSSSHVVKPKIVGGQKVQMFSSLLLSSGRKIKEVTAKGKTYLVSDDLKFYTKGENGAKTNVCEIMISRWFKSPLSDEELLNLWYVKDKDGNRTSALTEAGEHALKGISFRIPTQKQNSIDAFVIKSFLPAEYGDTVVLPSEIVQKAGSDFDIDKMSMYLKKFILNKKGEPIVIKFLDDSNSTIEERYFEYVKDASESLKEDMLIAKRDTKVEALREVIDETYEEANELKDQLDSYFEEESIVYRDGVKLFKQLSADTKERYWDLNDDLNSRGIKGIGKTLFFRDLTTEFIKNKKDKDVLILSQMLINYDKVLTNKGIAEAKIKEVKDAFKAAHITKDLFTPQIRNKVAKILADLSGIENIEEFAKFSIYKQNSRAALDNEYIESLERLVTHPANFENLVKPNSAEDLKKLTKVINKLKNIPEIDYTAPDFMMSRKRMSGLRDAFVRGKRAIGIAAVGQTNNSLNQSFLTFLDVKKLTKENFSQFDLDFLDDGKIKFAPGTYNTVTVEGKQLPTLSKIKNTAGAYISDIIGMFIDGYVDISKGPWIMELGAIPKTAGTWIFLLKLGLPIKTVAYFMNQPAIQELLKQSEIKGVSIFNEELRKEIEAKYDEKLVRDQVIPSDKQLESMVGKDEFQLAEKNQNGIQIFMMYEFLKYSKMASQLREVVDATNIDTANINDPFLLFKKDVQLTLARKNMISSLDMVDGNYRVQSAADAILESTFIGELNHSMHKLREAHPLILLSDKPRLRSMLQNILTSYVDKPDREFVKISQTLVSDLFDWAVQVDRQFNNTLRRVMLGTATERSAAEEISEFRDSVFGNIKKGIAANTEHPLYGNFALEAMTLIDGGNTETAKNIQLVGLENKAYDQNRIINSFDELKEYFKSTNQPELYGKIVRLAIMQSGLSTSKIAFSKLLPYNDFREVYNKTLSNIENLENLEDFEKLNVYQRINYNNPDVVREVKMKPGYDFINMRSTKSTYERQVPAVLKQAMDDNKIPKVIVRAGGADVIKLTWIEKISNEEKARRARTGDTSHFKKLLMRKVYLDKESKEPLIVKVPTKDKDKPLSRVVYVAINAWGNSFRAKEFYDYKTVDNNGVPERIVPASMFDNGMEKVERIYDTQGNLMSAPEVTDDVIINILQNNNNTTIVTVSAENKILKMQPDNIAKIKTGTKTITNRTEKEKLEEGIYTLPDGTKVEVKSLGLTDVKYIGDGILIDSEIGKSWSADEYAKAEGFKDWNDFKNNNKFSTNFINGTQSRYIYSITPIQKEALSLQPVEYKKGEDPLDCSI